MFCTPHLMVFPDDAHVAMAFRQLQTIDTQTQLLTLYPFAFARSWYLLILTEPLSKAQQQDVLTICLQGDGQVCAIPLALRPVIRLLERRRAQRAGDQCALRVCGDPPNVVASGTTIRPGALRGSV